MWFWFLCVAAATVYSAEGAGAGAARLVCYVEGARASDFTECTHLVYAGDARGEKLDALLKEYRKNNPRLKIVLRVTEADKEFSELLKLKHVQGLEIYDAHKSFNKTKVLEKVEDAKAALRSSGGGPLFLALPAHPELLAKYYDLRTLVKKADLLMVQTHALGLVKNMTYHPSRLSGLWDMMNTDSVVDLVVGLGVPASKIVISLPATARQFTLVNETLSTPGSPTDEEEPKEIDQAELCRQLRKGRWTLERDQDLSAPYAFQDKTWISFEDASSVDVKGKYARVRGLAGLALYKADRDTETPCGPTLRAALTKVLNQQSRAPRAAVLRSLENEILSAPGHVRALDALQVSPYRITQIVDSDGVIHSIREDTRTEFSCSRQGYFVHPRSCARFYRCVKFDQYSPEYTVFEFDCPAGLAFDSRYEVCVWPGSLPHSQACPGSSEIAPVPRTRFICPDREGYYADPENCRWFFACLDHGKAPLTAYEFRCPFGLGFDAEKLKCDWPWLVPACGNIARYEAEAFGFSGAALTGATGFQGKTAESVNIAAHQSLVSGASLDNLVGIQSGFLTKDDALDNNFIASQEISNGGLAGATTYQIDDGSSIEYALGGQGESSGISYKYVSADDINKGLIQATNYNGGEKYTSGSIILDDYRLPTGKTSGRYSTGTAQTVGAIVNKGSSRYDSGKYRGIESYPGASPRYDTRKYKTGAYNKDKSGAYVHNPAGDRAKPYQHIDVPPVPYDHVDIKYTQDTDIYSGFSDAGSYTQDSSASQAGSGGYVYPRPTIEFNEGQGAYQNLYSVEGHATGSTSNNYENVGGVTSTYNGNVGGVTSTYHGSYSNSDASKYVNDNKVYTGASHTLTAGAVNVGLVGKTSLVDVDYADKGNYQSQYYTQGVFHQTNTVAAPAVSISHVGTDIQNLDGFGLATTPTSSGIPTTATPVPVTTVKTTYVPEAPRTSIKQVFGYTQPAVTLVQPTVVSVKQVTPQVQVTDHSQGYNYQFENKGYTSTSNTGASIKTESTGYDYTKPAAAFEEGISYSTAAPAATIISYKPQGFGQVPNTVHKIESVGYEYSTPTPVAEEPFKRVVAYTTGPSVSTYVQPTAQSFSHQTIHKADTSNVYTPSVAFSSQGIANNAGNYQDSQSSVYYTAPQPTVSVQPAVSTYQPQTFSQQTLHTVDTSKIKTYSQGQSEQGYKYYTPSATTFLNTESENGYEYNQPRVQFEEVQKTISQYSTPAPTVTYRPQSYSSQNVQRFNTHIVTSTARPAISTTPVTIYENPLLKYTVKTTPTTYVSPTYTAQTFSQQTIHRDDVSKSQEGNGGYQYTSNIEFTAPQTYNSAQSTISHQPIISTYQPSTYSQQNIETYDASQTYEGSSASGYDYSQPAVRFEQTKIVSSTPAPVVSSTYRPQSYSHQTLHKVETPKIISTTPLSTLDTAYIQPEATVPINPFSKYIQNTVSTSYVSPTVTTVTQKPIQKTRISYVNQPSQYDTSAQQTYDEGYSYTQPEIQRNTASYSDASAVSHQVFHISHGNKNVQGSAKDVVFVSTTPSTLIYEDHFTEYDTAQKFNTYKAPEYIPPKYDYKQSFTVSSASTPIVQQESSQYQSRNQYDYKSQNNYEQYEIQPVDIVHHETSKSRYDTSQNSKNVKSVHFSTVPETGYTSQYNQAGYQTPEIQVAYKAEEYLPPVVSTATPVVTSTYQPRTFSTTKTREYLPPTSSTKFSAVEYLPPVETYSTQSTVKPEVKSLEYLPPDEQQSSRVVNFESFGYSNADNTFEFNNKYNINQDYSVSTETPIVISTATSPITRKQNIVVETAKSNLLGFGTVGPDAGLVSTAYTTSQPNILSSTEKYYLPPQTPTSTPETVRITSAPRRTKPKYTRPNVKTTTQGNVYVESSTSYQAPEYLPPSVEVSQESLESFGYKSSTIPEIKYNPYQEQVTETAPTEISSTRKQNIVVETAKSKLLGFGTVGTDAGLVTPITYTTPESVDISSGSVYSSTPAIQTYNTRQEFIEVTPSHIPLRKSKPKVAVVTKINDFNPLLVRKLGAVCSCQSPVLVLKGRRPNVQQQVINEYDDSYENSGRGDIGATAWAQKSNRVPSTQIVNTVTTVAPAVSSTFNPIIVPDDAYYQDYQEASNDNISVTPTQKEYLVSSTPISSTTERVVRIGRPRAKTVTVAPTYKTVLLNQEVTPTSIVVESEAPVSSIDSQSFDRYGPGGWRGRDETLQGSVDCKRAGLFRHPKQCNKFYACRWDCTKQRFTLHVFNCPVQLSFDPNIGACNWPSQGPACQGDTLLTNAL